MNPLLWCSVEMRFARGAIVMLSLLLELAACVV
jgi:hypothetical protein